MGQLARPGGRDEVPDGSVGSGQRLWLESCVECARPLTIVARERPREPRCAACAPGEAAEQ